MSSVAPSRVEEGGGAGEARGENRRCARRPRDGGRVREERRGEHWRSRPVHREVQVESREEEEERVSWRPSTYVRVFEERGRGPKAEEERVGM